jgi:hypothetical protein
MNLTESQVKAMLELGGSIESHDFIPQRDLNDLLSYGLIYWCTADDAEFTTAGKEVYEELAGSAGMRS